MRVRVTIAASWVKGRPRGTSIRPPLVRKGRREGESMASGAHFNPPPNWPVPRGWTPPLEWEPDPSWPPAPPGWQFWVEEPMSAEPFAHAEESDAWGPPSEPAVPGRRKIALIAGALTLAVALTAGTLAVVSWLGDDPAPAARPEGMLPGTYPVAPEVDWIIDASDVSAGEDPAFTSPVYGASYYASVGAVVVGDRLVVHSVPDRSSPDNAQMMAVDLTDGQVEWTRRSSARDGCGRELLGDLLPCRNAENYGSNSQIDFIDINTGEVTSSTSVPFYANMLASDGESLYTAGFRKPDGLVVAKGSDADPMSDWQVTIPGGDCEGYGGGDASDLRVRDGIVYGHQGGGSEIALHASDGSPVFDYAVTNVAMLDGPTVIGKRCLAGVDDMEDWPTEVVDGGGAPLFSTDEHVLYGGLAVQDGPPSVLVTANGAGLDAATGETLWRQQDWPGDWVTTAVVGDKMVFQGGQTDVLQAAALDTGAPIWGDSPAAMGESVLTDGPNLISVLHADIQARSLTDGKKLWSVAVPGVGDNDRIDLMATDQGLLFNTGQRIGLLRPTGPAAPVPDGASDSRAEENNGGTSLVTKCGTPPEFEPQEITTESGALAITMKVVAKCTGGDVISSPHTTIAVSTSDGQNVASAVFDLSEDPIVIGPDGSGDDPSVTHRFHFPAGTFWRLPVSVDEAPDVSSTQKGRVDIDAQTLVVECEPDGSGGGSGQVGSGTGSTTATAPAAPQRGDNESASFDALRAIANSDRPYVTRQLADRWVPQLSSKRPGLVADGIVWNNAETLREHLDLRLQYPEVRLLWTADWSTFSARDFWVTITGVTFPDAGGALAWCRDHGLDRDHCYAKLVSTTHPIDGSTAFNN